MKRLVFGQICSRLRESGSVELAKTEYPEIPLLTLEGIYQRLVQIDGRRSIWNFDLLKLSPSDLWLHFLEVWRVSPSSEEVIYNLSTTTYKVPPCYLARLIVKGYTAACLNRETKHSPVMAEVDDGDGGGSEHANIRLNFTKLYRDPIGIPHEGLALNVAYCHKADPHYSPVMDEYRNRIGKEYEDKLCSLLDELGVAYLNEGSMRKMKYARTPDAVLLEPIAVDGLIVKWIESKAWFGDPSAHTSYLRDQYWPYYNRFGPGLVIYWFGFVDEVVVAHHNQGVAVMDHFPGPTRIKRLVSSHEGLVRSAKPKNICN